MKTISTLITASVLTLALQSCGSSPQNGSRQNIAIPVSVSEVQSSNIEKFSSTTGNVVPTKQAVITSQIAGEYTPAKNPSTSSLYRVGDRVRKGDVVVRLIDPEYKNNTAVETKRISAEIAKEQLEKLITLEKKGGATKTEIRNAELSLANAQTDYENGKIALEKMSITSPISGTVVDFPHHTAGVRVEAGTEIMSVMDYSKMLLSVALSESTIGNVKKGQTVYITHYSFPGDTILATIGDLSPMIDTETRTYQGSVVIDNASAKLKPGMFVKADIVVEKADSVVVLPREIIRSIRGRDVVFVADGGVAQMRDVVLGIENEEMVQILSGVKVGERLIDKGYETLRDNSRIRVTN